MNTSLFTTARHTQKRWVASFASLTPTLSVIARTNMELKDLITPKICESTVFEDSWIWYCDDCRKHGIGGSAKEVEYYANSHIEWTSYADERSGNVEWDAEENIDPEDFEPILLSFSEVDEDDRFLYDWETTCEGAVFIISEGDNKTFELGEDYEDMTPNNITDIALAQEIKKQLDLP